MRDAINEAYELNDTPALHSIALDLQSRLSKANERIEFLENDAKNQSALSKAGEAWAEEDYKELQAELSKARERIEELEGENLDLSKKFVQEYEITMRQQARIKELEKPDRYEFEDQESNLVVTVLSEDEVRCVRPVKLLPPIYGFAKYRATPENPSHYAMIEAEIFNTLEEAQQAIEGEE